MIFLISLICFLLGDNELPISPDCTNTSEKKLAIAKLVLLIIAGGVVSTSTFWLNWFKYSHRGHNNDTDPSYTELQ